MQTSSFFPVLIFAKLYGGTMPTHAAGSAEVKENPTIVDSYIDILHIIASAYGKIIGRVTQRCIVMAVFVAPRTSP